MNIIKNPEFRWLEDAWIDALRDGEHFQGVGGLDREDTGTQCCLGVLCDIAGLPYVLEVGRRQGSLERYYFLPNDFDFNTGEYTETEPGTVDENNFVLPDEFTKILDVTLEDMYYLIEMNDLYDVSFDEIADYIESRQEDT